MNLLDIAAKLFAEKLGGEGAGLDMSVLASALGGLLGGEGGSFDLGDLIQRFSGGDLGSLVQSWLGDGGNSPLPEAQLSSVLGESKITDFASKLGVSRGAASKGLAEMIPELIDGNSSGGSLLDSVGGAGGVLDMASKFFK